MQFEVGKTYAQRFMCDWDSIAYFKVIGRTAKTVMIEGTGGKITKRRVSVYCGKEQFKPFGSYSMAMVVDASDTEERVKAQG